MATRSLQGRSSYRRGDAIEVDVSDEVVVDVRAPESGTGRHAITGEVAGVEISLAEGESDTGSWSEVIDVDRYARHSLGLHRVEIESPGCSAAALIRVVGHPPILTTAGAASIAAVVLGLVALVNAWTRGKRPARVQGRFYRVSEPFEHLDDLRTAADYVGWAEVLGDHQGRALVDEAPANRDIVEHLRQPDVQSRLDQLRSAGVRRFTFLSVADPLSAVAFLLPRLRWRPRFPIVGTVLAAVGGAGVLLLLQQVSVSYPHPIEVVLAAALGAVLELVVANTARVLGIRRANRTLTRAEGALVTAEEEPLYPPFEHTEAQWKPTHFVPATGMSAWAAPDPATSPVAHLDGRLPVEVVQQAGDWAWVHCSNGWTGWVDARLLLPFEDPAPTE